MKISTHTIRWHGYESTVALPTDQLVEKIGAQLGAVEETIQLAPKYQGAVVAQVISCA